MTPSHLAALFSGLFTDAAMFPPLDESMNQALHEHTLHRLAWYGDLVGSLGCLAERLAALDGRVAHCGLEPVDVSVVAPAGPESLPAAMTGIAHSHHLRVRCVELPLGSHTMRDGMRRLAGVAQVGLRFFLELPRGALSERLVHEMAARGVGLKLRAGGTRLHPFRPEQEVAEALVLCAAERLPLRCSGGVPHAVRCTDRGVREDHHGFLNIAWAARVAAATGSVTTTAAALGERDRRRVARWLGTASEGDVVAIRALLASFGACGLGVSVDELVELGLLVAP